MIGWLALLAFAPAPTFHRDIAPILQRHCQNCHRPGESAPMPLLTYQHTRAWAKSIRDAVLTKRMPPWHAEESTGQFRNKRSVSQSEIDAVRAWVDAGAPAGNPAHAPKPVAWPEGWQIGKPDLIITMPEEYDVPEKGTLDYIHWVVPTGFTEDKWIERIEVRPGNRTLVHHIGVYLRPKGSKWLPHAVPGKPFAIRDRIGTRGAGDELYAMYVPGMQPQSFGDGRARLIPAHSEIVFQMHYQPNGKPGKDRSVIGLVFAKEPPRERIHTIAVGNAQFAIPPGDPEHRVKANFYLMQPATLLSLTPHMHLRGRSMECRLTYPDKRQEWLLRVPRYDRNWQISYELAEERPLPANTWIQCWAVFDNSPNNPLNPDPKAEVKWGDQTTDEMMVTYMDIALGKGVTPADLYPALK